ncbi:MAG: quinonprotein alcohol dehydrogenase [Planctomyces sp.]|nr:quinonprotein alcohol dehydrogenase [Planctomyces sp.]
MTHTLLAPSWWTVGTRRWLFTLCLTLWLGSQSFVSTAEAQTQWPQFLGPEGNAHASSTKLPTVVTEDLVRWKTPIHGKGWSSPVIWGDDIWLTTATPDGHKLSVVCIDKPTGRIVLDKLLFEVEKPSEIHDFNSYASPTPVLEGGKAWISFGSYGTACLAGRSGEVLWQRRDLPCEHFRGPGSSPILFENLLIFHMDGFDFQYVVALDKETGRTVWKVDRQVDYGTENGDFKKAFCTPTIIEVDGQPQLISPTSKACLALDPRTGKEIWRIRYKEFSATVRPVYGHGLVFINTGFGKAALHAVDPTGQGDVTETHIKWSAAKGIPSKPSHVLVDDLLFMVHDGGAATCFEATTGKQLWQERLGGNFTSTPLYADGKLWFFSQEGKIKVLKASREFEELGESQLGDGFMASPAVSDDVLYLRSRSNLYRIGSGKVGS